MFSQVIAGVDGTKNGRAAIRLASKLVAPDGELTLVHVHPDGGVRFSERARRESLDLLNRQQVEAGVSAAVAAVGASSVGAGLQEIAEQRDADLLVVGSCSRGAVGRLMLGDDMRAALDAAPCAIAIAPRGYAGNRRPLRTIGIAYDGSTESEAALALARAVAAEHGAKIAALTVISMPSYSPYGAMAAINWSEIMNGLQVDAQARLDELDDVHGQAVQGSTTDALARFAEGLDLLVMGSRGYGPGKRMVLGSTSHHLARHAWCPLLVLRRGIGMRAEPSLPIAESSGVRA